MRVLFINGSPRRWGVIAQLMQLVRSSLPENCESEWVQVSDLNIAPCSGCMSCRKTKKCVLEEDGAQFVLKKIEEADALVVGSPCYWGNMNGHLKILFDRMVYGMMTESKRGIPIGLQQGKKVVLISSCTTRFPFNIFFHQSRGAVNAMKEILKWSGFKIVGSIEKGNTKEHPRIDKLDKYKCFRCSKKLS